MSAGEFAKGKNYPVGITPIAIRAADLDEDGTLDLVVANYCGDANCLTPGSVSVLLGNGDGSFQAAVSYPASSFVGSIVVADLNSDGHLDLAVANSGFGGAISVLLGNGDGTFQPAVDSDQGLAPGYLAVGDFNGDSKPDLAVTGGSGCVPPSYPVSVVLGNGDGTFGEPLTSCAGKGPAGLAVGDLDGDGSPDLVVANWNGGDGTNISVLLGNGGGTFRPAVNYAVGGAFSVQSVDLDHNGKLDVVVGSVAGTGSISVFLGNGDGTLQTPVTYGPGLFEAAGVALADFNGDGNLDVVGSANGAAVGVLLGKGDGAFYAALSTYPTAWEPASIAIGDFNGDGQLDMATANGPTNNVSVLLNAGNAPVATLSATGLRFGAVQVGNASSPQKVTLTNTGYSALTISSFTMTDDFVAKNDCGSSLAIQASCTITVQFRPRSVGLHTGNVTILDNAKPPGQVIHLRGGGTP